MACAGLVLLAGCGSGTTPAPREGKVITTPGIVSYTTGHNGYSRARIEAVGAEDAALVAQFDTDPTTPAGYRNIIELTEARYRETMFIEVIAEVAPDTDSTERVVRVLRMTADQAPFDLRARDGSTLQPTGQFYFRGEAEVYASRDGGELLRGRGELVNLTVNFDTETVSINIRTPFDPSLGSAVETEITALELPFSVTTGQFGGTVFMTTRSEVDGAILSVAGVLLGHMSGNEAGLTRLVENLTTSGLFTIGTAGEPFSARGVFWGGQLNPPS